MALVYLELFNEEMVPGEAVVDEEDQAEEVEAVLLETKQHGIHMEEEEAMHKAIFHKRDMVKTVSHKAVIRKAVIRKAGILKGDIPRKEAILKAGILKAGTNRKAVILRRAGIRKAGTISPHHSHLRLTTLNKEGNRPLHPLAHNLRTLTKIRINPCLDSKQPSHVPKHSVHRDINSPLDSHLSIKGGHFNLRATLLTLRPCPQDFNNNNNKDHTANNRVDTKLPINKYQRTK